jgi:Icc-related predicted phosphoesterase
MNKTKNKIPFKHSRALEILREERELLIDDLKTVKAQINHMQFLRMNEPDDYRYFYYESLYGGTVSKLTKRQTEWRKTLKGIEESIKLLKEAGQKDHENVFQIVQTAERFKKEGSYNCSYGC